MFVHVALDLPAAAFVLLKMGILVDIGRWGLLIQTFAGAEI